MQLISVWQVCATTLLISLTSWKSEEIYITIFPLREITMKTLLDGISLTNKVYGKVLYVCIHTYMQSHNLSPQPDVTSFDIHS